MAFNDPDPVEEQMNLRVEEMTPAELVIYIQTYQGAFDRHMAVEGFIERSIFKSMQKIYGQATAGQIVKWAMYKYHGVYAGDVITFTSFAKGRKWWNDRMHQELQAHLRQERPPTASRVAVGSVRLSDL